MRIGLFVMVAGVGLAACGTRGSSSQASMGGVRLHAQSTTGWGCPCAPFALADTAEGGKDFVFVETRPGAPDPSADVFHPGPLVRFVLHGKYTGRETTPLADAKAKRRPLEEGMAEAPASPIFAVERWCLTTPSDAELAELDSAEIAAGYRSARAKAADQGVLCK